MSSPLRRRRTHSKAFKARVIAQCQEPGASIAAVAMAHQINDNLLRTWLRKAEQADDLALADKAMARFSRIVPMQPAAPVADPASSIRVHIQRGNTRIHVEWPVAQAVLCRDWLQGWAQ